MTRITALDCKRTKYITCRAYKVHDRWINDQRTYHEESDELFQKEACIPWNMLRQVYKVHEVQVAYHMFGVLGPICCSKTDNSWHVRSNAFYSIRFGWNPLQSSRFCMVTMFWRLVWVRLLKTLPSLWNRFLTPLIHPRGQGVVVFNMNDVPIGFGITARSTTDCRKLDAAEIVCLHQSDLGEYLREEASLF